MFEKHVFLFNNDGFGVGPVLVVLILVSEIKFFKTFAKFDVLFAGYDQVKLLGGEILGKSQVHEPVDLLVGFVICLFEVDANRAVAIVRNQFISHYNFIYPIKITMYNFSYHF